MRDPKDITILVVDDEEALRKAIVFDFKRRGFNVLDADNGRTAFEIAQKNNIDVILTDVQMPGGDGVELLDNIRKSKPGTPVVMFITGFADITLEESFHRGADAVFPKPFDRKALVAAVMKSVTPKDVVWNRPEGERLDAKYSITLDFPDLDFAIQGKVMNLGRGGMFVSLADKFPPLNAKTTFTIKFNKGTISDIDGTGIVKWIRMVPADGYPPGCGVEFLHLSDTNRKQIISIIEGLNTKSYIPKV